MEAKNNLSVASLSSRSPRADYTLMGYAASTMKLTELLPAIPEAEQTPLVKQ